MIKKRITYYAVDGTTYSELCDDADDGLEIGDWTKPFPNEYGNSTAFGLEESLSQSSDCPSELRCGNIARIVVSNAETTRALRLTKTEYDIIVSVLVRYLDAISHFGAGKDTLLPICEKFVEGEFLWENLE